MATEEGELKASQHHATRIGCNNGCGKDTGSGLPRGRRSSDNNNNNGIIY